jgi:hypothetical protein
MVMLDLPKRVAAPLEANSNWRVNMSNVDEKPTAPPRPTESMDLPLAFGMSRIRNVTQVTIETSLPTAMRLFGTRNPDFLFGLVHQVANASSNGESPDELGIKFMLGLIQSRAPRDEIDAMILANMATVQTAAMKYAKRLSEAESIQEGDSAERALNKLVRTFANLVQAYDRRRALSREAAVAPVAASGGAQKINEKETPPSNKPRLRLAGSPTGPDDDDWRPPHVSIRKEKR